MLSIIDGNLFMIKKFLNALTILCTIVIVIFLFIVLLVTFPLFVLTSSISVLNSCIRIALQYLNKKNKDKKNKSL